MAQESDHDRISRKAHEIWESEGRPHGRDQQHWDQAKEIVALHDSMGDTLLPRDTGVREPEEPTQSVEAYGDMPNLTDQGRDDLTDIDREPESTKPSKAVYTSGRNDGHVARPADTATDGDVETVTPSPKVKPVTPTPSNPTLGTPAPRPAKAGKAEGAPAAAKPASAKPPTRTGKPGGKR